MSPKGTPGDLEKAVEFYLSGVGSGDAAKQARVGFARLETTLRERGLKRDASTAGVMRGATRRKRYDAFADKIVRRYTDGETLIAISEDLGISRAAIKRRLERADVAIRSAREVHLLRSANMTPEERRAQTARANEAMRGHIEPLERKIRRARTVEARQLHTSPDEQLLQEWLKQHNIPSIAQKAIGPYNTDLGAFPVAVEIFGGGWHNTGRHAARTPDRARYILDQGWNLVVVWNDLRLCPFTPACADYIAAFYERSRRDPTFRSEYRVIWGDGKEATPLRPDLDDLALKPSRSGRKSRRS